MRRAQVNEFMLMPVRRLSHGECRRLNFGVVFWSQFWVCFHESFHVCLTGFLDSRIRLQGGVKFIRERGPSHGRTSLGRTDPSQIPPEKGDPNSTCLKLSISRWFFSVLQTFYIVALSF